jgi:hypothetical protein
MTFSMMCVANIVVMVVYWGTLHTERMLSPEMQVTFVFWASIADHLTPFLFNWLNFSLTDIVIKG